jgi:hypothetical protein
MRIAANERRANPTRHIVLSRHIPARKRRQKRFGHWLATTIVRHCEPRLENPMGLFKRSPEPLPPEYDAVLSCHPDARDYLIKSVHTNLPALQQMLTGDERLEMLTTGDDIGEVGVLTSTRTFSLKKGKVREGPLAWQDIETVELGKIPRNGGTYMIWLFTEAFRLDYRDDDPKKWTQAIKFTGRVERDIAATVRRLRDIDA